MVGDAVRGRLRQRLLLIELGASGVSNPLDDTIFDNNALWIGLGLDGGGEIGSRMQLRSVPFARRAGTATSVSGGTVDATEISVGGQVVIDSTGILVGSGSLDSLGPCTGGEVATFDGSSWTCAQAVDNDTLADLSCGNDAIVTWNVSANSWRCTLQYTDTTALSAMGVLGDSNPLNHARFTNPEAVSAMGSADNSNPLNHLRYTDVEARAAVGSHVAALPWTSITNRPTGLDDGDDDLLAALACAGDGEVPQIQGGVWVCEDADVRYVDAAGDFMTGTLDATALVSQSTLSLGTTAAACDSTTAGQLRWSPSGSYPEYCSGAAWTSMQPGGGGGAGSGLLFSFDFDEVTGTTFADTSGGGNNALTTGSGISVGAQGHSGKAVAFLGGVVSIPTGNSVIDSPSMTLETWIKPTFPLTGTRTIAMREGAWKIYQVNDQVLFDVYAVGGVCTVTSAGLLAPGVWNHISGSYDGQFVRASIGNNWFDVVCENF